MPVEKKPDGPESAKVPELGTLYPAARLVTIAGRQVEIPACTLKRGGQVIDAGFPLWQKLRSGATELTVVEDEPELANAVLIAATGLDAEWIASLDPIDKLHLAAAWLEQNADFFCLRLLPARFRLHLAIAGLIGDGRTASATSSATAT